MLTSICSDLPSEVLEEIFYHLDGVSLAKCRQVCRRWLEIIQNMHSVSDVWKNCCLREISTDVLRQLCGQREIIVTSREQPAYIIDWLSKYKLWMSGTFVTTKVIPEYLTISNDNSRIIHSPITCIKVSGSVVITGHRDGNVQLWDTGTGEKIHTVTKHFRMVSCLELVDILSEGLYRVYEEYESHHHHVITISRDRIIQISPVGCGNSEEFKNYLFLHSDVLDSVKVFGNRFLVHCMDNTMSLWHMKTPESSTSLIRVTLLLLLQSPVETFATVNFWQQKISYLADMRVHCSYDLEEQKWKQTNQIKLSWPENSSYSPTGEFPKAYTFVTKAFCFLKNLMFFTTLDALLFVSCDGKEFHVHQPIVALQSPVLSICFWGSLLALGMESGALYLYHVPELEMISKLNLKNYAWTDQLSEASIIAVDIFDGGTGPSVVAASNEEIFFIHWRSER